MIKRISISILLTVLTYSLCAQGYGTCPVCYEPYLLPEPETIVEYVHDTSYVYVSNLDDITREFGMSFDEYARTFLAVKDRKDKSKKYSTEKVYLNFFLPLLNPEDHSHSYRFITREYTVTPQGSEVHIDLTKHELFHDIEGSSLQTDCMVTISGVDQTNTFLNSPSQIRSCLGQLFSTINNADGKIQGVNFYFPDFDFEQKRDMAQFIKSANMVINGSKIRSIQELRLYSTYNHSKAREHYAFLDGVAQMTDSVFIFSFENSNCILPRVQVINQQNANALNLFQKITNQFYLARYYTGAFPQTSNKELKIHDIYRLVDADYPDNHWELFMFITIGLLLLVLLLFFLYRCSPFVAYYMNRSIDYVYTIALILTILLFILIAYMLEAMSRDDVFTLNDQNRYIVLLLPVVFIVIIPLMKVISKKRNLP